jgi:hypothetical protein
MRIDRIGRAAGCARNIRQFALSRDNLRQSTEIRRSIATNWIRVILIASVKGDP